MSRSVLLALLALITFLASPLAAQHPRTTAGDAPSLQPGDMVRVQIWREEDLSGEFLVDEHGVLTLPMVGETTVTGVPLDSLRDRLVEAYRLRLRNPSIIITPLRRVIVLGEVQKPGLYPVDLTVSLADAVALAGGVASTGDMRKIRIVRDGQLIRERVGIGERLASADIRSGDQIIVEKRSWFVQNWLPVASFALSASSILFALLR